MAETLIIPQTASKEEIYKALLPQIESLIGDEPDQVANLANVCAVLKEAFGFFWVGFYLVKEEQLVLGPFQGPIACTRINFGKGVCGTAWKEASTQLVPDVDAFPGHIACSSASKSEVVVPCFSNGKIWGVLDVDSDQLNDFDKTDVAILRKNRGNAFQIRGLESLWEIVWSSKKDYNCKKA
jgi:L-methionine (R)-S-oxide reductase